MIQDNAGPKRDAAKMRKLIRKKVAELLKNNTAAGKRVFPNASVPPNEKQLPVILIYPRSESAAKYAEAPRELERGLDLAIEIYAAGPEVDEDGNEPEDEDSLEDILDDLSEQVERIMHKDETLQGTADDSILTNTEMEFSGTGAQPIGSSRLTYSVTYYTHAPRSIEQQLDRIDNFEKANVDWNISDDDNTREAKDTIALDQT